MKFKNVIFSLLFLAVSFPLKSQNTIVVFNHSNREIYCFSDYVNMDGMFHAQPNHTELQDIAPFRMDLKNFDENQNSLLLNCLSSSNQALVSSNRIFITIHLILNENAVIQASGISFNNNIIVLNETELSCLLNFMNTLQFGNYYYKPAGSFLYNVNCSYRLKP